MLALPFAGLPHCLPQLGLTSTAVAVALHLCAIATPQACDLQQGGWYFTLCCTYIRGSPWRGGPRGRGLQQADGRWLPCKASLAMRWRWQYTSVQMAEPQAQDLQQSCGCCFADSLCCQAVVQRSSPLHSSKVARSRLACYSERPCCAISYASQRYKAPSAAISAGTAC